MYPESYVYIRFSYMLESHKSLAYLLVNPSSTIGERGQSVHRETAIPPIAPAGLSQVTFKLPCPK